MSVKHQTSKLQRRRFITLVELMITLAISGFILTTVVTVLIQTYAVYRDTTADFYLSQFGRIAREKLLRGDGGKYGLREAQWSSIQYGSDIVTYSTDENNEDPIASLNTVDSSFTITEQLPAVFGGVEAGNLIKADVEIERQILESSEDDTYYKLYKEERGFNVYTLLKLVINGKSYLAEHKIGATVVND